MENIQQKMKMERVECIEKGGFPGFGDTTETLEKILKRYNNPGVDPLASTWFPPNGSPRVVITIPGIRAANTMDKDDTTGADSNSCKKDLSDE